MTESLRIYTTKSGKRWKYRIEFQPQNCELIGQTLHDSPLEAVSAGVALAHHEINVAEQGAAELN